MEQRGGTFGTRARPSLILVDVFGASLQVTFPPCPPCSWEDISGFLRPLASGWIHPTERLGRRLGKRKRGKSEFLLH